jgi:HAD superfamily hydrolase (TIGR01509 family)
MGGLGVGGPPVGGLIFDMDGTIVDNRRFHMDSWRVLVAELGLSERHYTIAERAFGKTNMAIFDDWFAGSGNGHDYDALGRRKEEIYRELAKGGLIARPGFYELLDLADRRGWRIGLATSGPKENALFALGEMGVLPRFHAVIWSNKTMRSKPAPDYFLAAATRMGVPPTRCIGFEDSSHGIWAVRRAGMRVIAIAEHPADRVRSVKWTPYLYNDFVPAVRLLRAQPR